MRLYLGSLRLVQAEPTLRARARVKSVQLVQRYLPVRNSTDWGLARTPPHKTRHFRVVGLMVHLARTSTTLDACGMSKNECQHFTELKYRSYNENGSEIRAKHVTIVHF